MSTITTKDGVQIFYKDWGHGQPIVFHHGWPLSSDDWDTQMLFFLQNGYRVIGIDRRGHGRSSQVWEGHDMDHYAADAADVVDHLDLRNAVHIGHSTGGGEVARYVARHGKGRVAKAVLMSAVAPLMLKTASNPDGLPIQVFDGLRAGLAANRAQFYRDVPAGPFYGFNRPGATPIEGSIQNWWRQGMMGGAKAHYDSIKAFSETDFTEDLKSIDVANAGDARRRRPDRPLQGRGLALGEAAEEQHAEDLSRLPARHADHPRRRDQPGPPGVHSSVKPSDGGSPAPGRGTCRSPQAKAAVTPRVVRQVVVTGARRS
jgi:non-heme chloroperoxidase